MQPRPLINDGITEVEGTNLMIGTLGTWKLSFTVHSIHSKKILAPCGIPRHKVHTFRDA
jgi:hypothetical protein